MDQGLLLVLVAVVLAIVVIAWIARELVGVARRRRDAQDAGSTSSDAAVELVPLLLEPLGRFVKRIGRKRTSIDELIGPDGDVSVLFSDIEGSTALNHRLGDEDFVRVIRAHDEVVDGAVARHGGVVVKTQGDGFMAAFRTAADAVSAAVELGPAVEGCEEIDVELPLRVGVHTGRVVSTSSDLFGTTVAMAARVADTARGGEVLVSDAVRIELDGHDGLAFHERRGSLFGRGVRVKGIPGRHRIHAVTSSATEEG